MAFRIFDDGDKVSDQPLSSLITGQAQPTQSTSNGYHIVSDPQLGNPQPLSFAEEHIAPVLEKLGVGDIAGGNLRGSAVGGAFQGAADPGIAIGQMIANHTGFGDTANRAVQQENQQYEQARQDAGRSGADLARAGGNIGMAAFATAAVPGASTMPVTAVGAGQGLLTPVTNGGENFDEQKLKQAGGGALMAKATSLLGSMLGRVVSPKASTNPDVQLLRDEGVNPTIGQALGGWANSLEEKAMSIPFVGDAIRNARGRSLEDFNRAALSRTTNPVGASVNDIGTSGYAQAKGALQDAYQAAAGNVNHINFDTPEFNAQLGELTDMANGLTDPMQKKFWSTLTQVVLRKMSPNGSILGSDLKAVDADLGQVASNYSKSSDATQRELGSAIKQLQAIVRQQVARSDPAYAAAQGAADAGWRNLIPVRSATKAAVNNNGIFTPAQLNLAARSAGGNLAASGTAPMQDLATAAQNVIGNKLPNSFTTDRAAMIAALFHPAAYIPAAAGAVGGYSRPVQNALVSMFANRPESAPIVANYLRQLALPATLATVPLLEQQVAQ